MASTPAPGQVGGAHDGSRATGAGAPGLSRRPWHRGGVRRPRLGLLLGLGVPLLVIALLLGAWAVDTGGAAAGSLRNVELAGQDVGGRTNAAVREAVARRADTFGRTDVEIRAGSSTIETTAAELGLAVAQEPTVDAVLDEGRDGPTGLRPLAWARSFVAPYEVALQYTLRRDQLALVLAEKEGAGLRQPVEPTIVASADAVGVQSGVVGRALDPEEVAARLLDAATAGEDPITINVAPDERVPQVSDADARALADRAQALTAEPITATVAGMSATFEVPEMRSWIGSRVGRDGIELTLDTERIEDVLRDLIGSLGDAEPRSASFNVVGGAVRLTPGVTRIRCCAPKAADQIAAALKAGTGTIKVQPIKDEPDLTTEEAYALGITEPVGTVTNWQGQPQVKSFTTYFDCCQPRAVNIRRIADLVRGTLVLPGDTFSINERVGPRTPEKGFVVAGAIDAGDHVEEVGGGVSQFATTAFNAAFFAGLPFEEYQAHSEHFDRYPRGREATMGFPSPDLKFTNDTPYGILVWTSHTDTSVTVTLYSTPHAFGQQTGQTEVRSGPCTTVTTQRTITYPDGRTAVDEVRARYRDPGVTSC